MKKRKKRAKRPSVFDKLRSLYERMDQAYTTVAERAGLSCQDCADNCCTSYFQHHTRIEWAFLWQGFSLLPQEKQDLYMGRAREYVRQSRELLAAGARPRIMCPVNDNGLCGMYEHRLMICRLHGTANTLSRPDGMSSQYPGCFRFQEIMAEMDVDAPWKAEAAGLLLDRTPLYRELVALEVKFAGNPARPEDRVNLTLAEMLVNGAPMINESRDQSA